MVDVTEHGDDRRARRQHLGLVLFLLDRHFFAGFLDDGVEAEALRDLDRDVARNVLVDRRHRADLDQLGDHVLDRNDHRGREFLHRQQVRDLDRLERARRRGDGRLALLLALPLLFEQQLLLAIFFGGGLVLVRARCGRRGGRRVDGAGRLVRAAPGRARSRARAGRHRTERTVAGRAALLRRDRAGRRVRRPGAGPPLPPCPGIASPGRGATPGRPGKPVCGPG